MFYTSVCVYTVKGYPVERKWTLVQPHKRHYIRVPLLFKGDHPHTHAHTHTHTVNTLKVMFLQAARGQVSGVINQLPGWFCIVYYCRTHHSSALKASDPWRVPVCVTVMDIVITLPSLSLYLSFCSVELLYSPSTSSIKLLPPRRKQEQVRRLAQVVWRWFQECMNEQR